MKTTNKFLLGLRAKTPGIKAVFINASSACRTVHNPHVHNNSTATPWLIPLPQRSAAGSQAEWYVPVGPLSGVGFWVLFFCFCYRKHFSKYLFQLSLMSHFPPKMEPEFRGQDRLPQEVCVWFLWNGWWNYFFLCLHTGFLVGSVLAWLGFPFFLFLFGLFLKFIYYLFIFPLHTCSVVLKYLHFYLLGHCNCKYRDVSIIQLH